MKDKILIIEDEPNLLASLSKELKTTYDVFTAVDGNEGLKVAFEIKPDLILLDILLPQMSGEELMVKLRQDDWGKTAKVVVITNLEDPVIEENLRKLKILDYIVKSNISIDELSNIILKYLHPGRSVYLDVGHPAEK